MFGFGKVHGLNRKQYNDRIRYLLENAMSIVTDHDRNPMFPGDIKFGQLMDEGWVQKCCPEDNAIYIALRYWSGTAKAGGAGLEEARRIDGRVRGFLLALCQSTMISEPRGQQFQKFYEIHRHQLQYKQDNKSLDYFDEFKKNFDIRNEDISNKLYLAEVFKNISNELISNYSHIGGKELNVMREAYGAYISARGAGFPQFDMQTYSEAVEQLFAALESLRDAFARNGLDITELWHPFVQGVVDDIDIVEKLAN